jgi:cell division protein FtsI (penicillin-binding protein 3)
VTTKKANTRIRFLAVAFIAVFAVALGRAAWVQGVHGGTYSSQAERQNRETVVLPAGRGTIYDRNNEPLAIGEQATTVYADPRIVADPRTAALTAGKILRLDPNELYPLLANRSTGFTYVFRKADPVRADKLAKLQIGGFGFYPEELRTYPQKTVAASVLGYAGVDNRGLEGLEASLDKTLAGRDGSEVVVKDASGQAIDIIESRPEQRGKNVVLTLDSQIQANAESVLADTVRAWGARGGTAVVMDVRTGAVLAMANAPVFNANRFATTSADRRRNRAITDTYEPGSTFKLVTVTAALEDNVVSPTTAFTLPSSIKVADRTIRESHARGTQRMTVKQIISESSNVGTVTIASRLGAGRLADWVSRFGFGKTTGIDFPGESPGIVLPLEEWSGSTIGTVPIGQGIAVTPMQMVSAYATVGNHGVRNVPRLIHKIGGRTLPRATAKRIVRKSTARQVMAMLRDVVVEGTGTQAAVPGYTVAGKTGTASKPENGRYVAKYVASFVGLVPAKNPRLAILVAIDEPRGQIWGGVVAAPAFAKIAKFDLQYLEVPPDAPATRAG